MKPYVVLKIDVGYMGETTKEVIENARDAWIAEYERIAKWSPHKEEICEMLIDRVNRAANLCIRRYTPPTIKTLNSGGHDDAFYEWYDQMIADEDAKFDGDFPLGNGFDADFATPYFTIKELAEIQCGATYTIKTGDYVEPAYDVLVRKGFIAELVENWAEAERCYGGVPTSRSVDERQEYCRKKKIEEGKRCYAIAQDYMQSGQWKEIYPPLARAVDMENTDAMVDMALARVYGTFNFSTDMEEALMLLRKAALMDNERACFELVELHDSGVMWVEGDEAKAMCEKAASLGNKKAEVRLTDGFDIRPLPVILEEQSEKGNVDALWLLHVYWIKKENYEQAALWYEKALEAGQTDAMLWEATACFDKKSEKYNIERAEHYLRRAADKGNIKAIIGMGNLALCAGDDHFWELAAKREASSKDGQNTLTASAELEARHKSEFAWYKLAAEGGDADAMSYMCMAYRLGYPVERDYKEAFDWAVCGVDAGDISCMYQAAYLLENGFGVEKDVPAAVQVYEEAAEFGDFSSMIRLYKIYSEGAENVPADKAKADKYLWMSGIGHS